MELSIIMFLEQAHDAGDVEYGASHSDGRKSEPRRVGHVRGAWLPRVTDDGCPACRPNTG